MLHHKTSILLIVLSIFAASSYVEANRIVELNLKPIDANVAKTVTMSMYTQAPYNSANNIAKCSPNSNAIGSNNSPQSEIRYPVSTFSALTPSAMIQPITSKFKTPSKAFVPAHCKREMFTIHGIDDLSLISGCKTVTGDIEILGFTNSLLLLPELEVLEGSLFVKLSPELLRMEAPRLSKITGWFRMEDMTSLILSSFPALSSIRVLHWSVLPILSNAYFSPQGVVGLKSLTIVDTSLTSISGFSADELTTFDINNNRYLEYIHSDVQQITEKLHVAANAREVSLNLPLLKSTHNLSIHDVADFDMGELESIRGLASIISNQFTELKLPKLLTVDGTLNLAKNGELNMVELPSLHDVGGGLIILNNTLLQSIEIFPQLEIIGGALELLGHIKEARFTKLKLIKGSARIRLSASSFNCGKWASNEMRSVVRGRKIECTNTDNKQFSNSQHSNGGLLLTIRLPVMVILVILIVLGALPFV